MLTRLKKSYGQAGLKSCLLTFFQPSVGVGYATPAQDAISTLPLVFQAGRSVWVDGSENAGFSETHTSTLNGELFIQSITLGHAGLSTDKRQLLEGLRQDRVTALVQDKSGQWWAYGLKRGLKLRYKHDAESGTTFTLNGLEREPACLVDSALIPGFLTSF